MTEYWYRYRDEMRAGCSITEWGGEDFYTTGPHLVLDRYEVLRHTPKGVWVRRFFGEERWVSATARRRLCYPTEEQAMTSFIARKRRQTRLLTLQLKRAQRALQLGEQAQQERIAECPS